MNKITKIVLWLVVIMFASFLAGGILVAIGGLSSYDFTNPKYNDNINVTKNISTENTTGIIVDVISEDVKIMSHDSEEIVANMNGFVMLSENEEPPKLIIDDDEGILKISVQETDDWTFDFGMRHLNVDLYIPKSYRGNVEIDTVSAEIELDELTTDSLSIETISGDIRGTNMFVKKLDLSSTSGDISLKGHVGSAILDTVSGDIKIISDELTGNYDVDTTSGDVSLDFDEDASFSIEFDSTSGDVSSTFPMVIDESKNNYLKGHVGESNIKIAVDTTSGDLMIK